MTNVTWKLNELAANIGESIDMSTNQLIELKDEIQSIHRFLNELDLPRHGSQSYRNGNYGILTVGERLHELKYRKIEFESISTASNLIHKHTPREVYRL